MSDSSDRPPSTPDRAPGVLSPSQRILTVTEEELSRIILDIHDGPVQYLFTALSLLTGIQQEAAHQAPPDLSPRLAQVGMLLESSLYEIKFFMGAFRPPELVAARWSRWWKDLVIQHEEDRQPRGTGNPSPA
ncbi:MAG: hypothetical protein R3E79_11480 [Caldilineaceae bacterium]